jgi:hypothetical protein
MRQGRNSRGMDIWDGKGGICMTGSWIWHCLSEDPRKVKLEGDVSMLMMFMFMFRYCRRSKLIIGVRRSAGPAA